MTQAVQVNEVSLLKKLQGAPSGQDPLKHLLGLVFNCVVMNMIKLVNLISICVWKMMLAFMNN